MRKTLKVRGYRLQKHPLMPKPRQTMPPCTPPLLPFEGQMHPSTFQKQRCPQHTRTTRCLCTSILPNSLEHPSKPSPPSSALYRSSRTRAINDCTAVGSSRPEIAARYRSASSRARDPDAPFGSSSHRWHSSTSSSCPPPGTKHTCTRPRTRVVTCRGQPGTEPTK